MTSFSPPNLLSRSLIGAVGLGVALLGLPTPVKAAAACGPGNHWVDSCAPGVDVFPTTKAYLDMWLMFPSQPMQQVNLNLTGPATVERYDPVDALPPYPNNVPTPNDPNWNILGTVGIVDGHNGVIPTYLQEKFQKTVLGLGAITLTGKGYGSIVEATESGINRPDLASSFFKVFAELETPYGKAKNQEPITVYGNNWLTGVSPTEVPPIAPGQINPASLTNPSISSAPAPALPGLPSNFNEVMCNANNPLAAIIYCGFDNTDFYAVNDAGLFIDSSGNVTNDPNQYLKVATLHSEAHAVAIPEPSIVISLAVLGFGAALQKKWGKKKQKDQ
jgi:hypothetical protein